MSAFQIHPSWFDDYWLKPRPARPPRLIRRMIRGAIVLYRRTQTLVRVFYRDDEIFPELAHRDVLHRLQVTVATWQRKSAVVRRT